MKKRFTFFTMAISMLAVGNFSFAQDYYEDIKTMNIYSTEDWINIDGVDDEPCWSATEVTENALGIVLHNPGIEPTPNTWGYAATYKAVYDANYVYFFIKVKDNTYVPYDVDKMTGETNVDNLEIFFFPDPNDRDELNVNIDARSRGLSQLRASVGNEDNRATGGGFAAGSIVNYKITGYEYKTRKTDDGYDIEMIIPWSVVIPEQFRGNLEEGKKIMFDINAANCVDYTSTRVIIIGWSGDDYNNWKYNPKMGEMVFKGPLSSSSIREDEMSKVDYSFVNGLLSLQNANNTKVAIYDISGKLVHSLVYTQPIDLSYLESGLYIVNIGGTRSIKIVN